jgi:hypothetical protein
MFAWLDFAFTNDTDDCPSKHLGLPCRLHWYLFERKVFQAERSIACQSTEKSAIVTFFFSFIVTRTHMISRPPSRWFDRIRTAYQTPQPLCVEGGSLHCGATLPALVPLTFWLSNNFCPAANVSHKSIDKHTIESSLVPTNYNQLLRHLLLIWCSPFIRGHVFWTSLFSAIIINSTCVSHSLSLSLSHSLTLDAFGN